MKHLALIFGALLWSIGAHATNGINLIGLSGASNALGGTGVANPTNGVDAIHKNPSLLGELTNDNTRWSTDIVATFISQASTASSADDRGSSGARSSQAGSRLIPQIAASYRLTPQWAVGVGVLGTAGAAIDQKDEDLLYQLKTQLTILRFAPTVAWKPFSNFSIGVSPFATWSQLALNEATTLDVPHVQSDRQPAGVTALGAEVGATFAPSSDWTIGASYTTKVMNTFPGVFNLEEFGPSAAANDGRMDDLAITQPWEFALGGTYQVIPSKLRITADYRFIAWSNSEGYRDFGWNDQSVFALGGQYQWNAWAFRLGFNYAQSVVGDVSGEVGSTVVTVQGHQVYARNISYLNMVAFPALTRSHFTAGAGYQWNDKLKFDAAFMWAPKSTVTRSGTFPGGSPALGLTGNYTLVAEASQLAGTVGATYSF